MSSTITKQQFYLQRVAETCRRIKGYTEHLNQEQFEDDRIVFDATTHNLVVLGEQAKKVPEVIREQTPEIDWPEIARLGDSLMTLPLDIDTGRVWKFVTEDVPALTCEIERLLKANESER